MAYKRFLLLRSAASASNRFRFAFVGDSGYLCPFSDEVPGSSSLSGGRWLSLPAGLGSTVSEMAPDASSDGVEL